MREQLKASKASRTPAILIGLAVFWSLVGTIAVPMAVSEPMGKARSKTIAANPIVQIRALQQVQLPDLPSLGEPAPHLPEPPRIIRLVLDLGDRRVYLYQGDAALASYPVAIGAADTPTPVGEFAVFQMVEDPVWQSPWTGEVRSPGANSALGLRWIGFARMPNGVIGFHGTPTVASIGRAASNGCVRMRNEDVVALFEQVEMGTAVVVQP